MDLMIRSLESGDNREQIFELCRQNNLSADYYATNYNVWNLQYENNPLRKSWNSVLIDKDENVIHGHMGLSPQMIRAFSADWTAGLINNGVIGASTRNKLLPFNNKKTFAIAPLIDCCVNDAFNDHVDFCIANTTIHPLIWKTLKFDTINIERKTTVHCDIKTLLKAYFGLFNKIVKNKYIKFFAIPFSLALTTGQVLIKAIGNIRGVFTGKSCNMVINRIFEFDETFNDFFNCFYKANPEVITCKRDIDFLNWKFKNTHFNIYTFKVGNKLVGYIILERKSDSNDDNNYNVMDCVILNEYLPNTADFLKKLWKAEKLRITFIHYLSCSYTYKLFEQCLKKGFLFTLSPLDIAGLDKRKRHVTSTLYYKINNKSKITQEQRESISEESWFITPILFYPGGYYP